MAAQGHGKEGDQQPKAGWAGVCRPRGPILPEDSSPHPHLTCQYARLLRWFDRKDKQAPKRAVEMCVLCCCQASRKAEQVDRARADVL